MNTIILAGGYAERLWPLTTYYPKTLLNIAGKPVLYHLLDNLTHIPALENIIIAIDDNKKDYFIDKIDELNTYSTLRPELSIHSMTSKNTPKGPLTKLFEIINNNKFITSENDYFIIGGDNLFGFDLNNFISFYIEHKSNCIASQIIDKKADVSQYGVPRTDVNNRLTDFIEKPREVYHQDRSTCFYILKNHIIQKINKYIQSLKDQEESLGLFIRSLINETEILVYKFKDNWYDIGNREQIISANSYLIKSDSKYRHEPKLSDLTNIIDYNYIHDSAYISKSTVGPNVYIDKDVIIKNSSIANSIIYKGCIINNSVIRDSVLGPDSKVEGKINEALYGPQSYIAIES